MVDLNVKNAIVVTAHGAFEGGLAIDEGKIVSVGTNASLPDAQETIDVRGMYVTPGFVDSHTHFREPGMSQKEDWDSGSRAAAAGGFTTIFDMPNCIPPTASLEAYRAKQELARGRAMVDYGLYGGVVDNNVSELRAMAEAGCIGFKLFMAETVGKVPYPPDDVIFAAFREIKETGRIVSVHAENGAIEQFLTKELQEQGRIDPGAHYESRPVFLEEEAIGRAIAIACGAGNRLHIVHLSTANGVDLVRRAKERQQPVTAEALVNHLLLAVDEHGHLGSLIKMNPPIRSSDHRSALWHGLQHGWLDNIAADHAPHAPDEKFNGNVWDVGAGYPALETNIPLMLTEVNAGRLTLSDLVNWYSEKPARMWGIYPRKGTLQVGSDADFVVIDLAKTKTIDAEQFHSKAKFSPFNGWTVQGSVEMAFLRGGLISDRGQIVGAPRGQQVVPDDLAASDRDQSAGVAPPGQQAGPDGATVAEARKIVGAPRGQQVVPEAVSPD